MKTQHTSGPWIVRQVNDGTLDVEFIANGIRSILARLHCEHLADEHGGNILANARLIAAAPIGYELAEYVLHLGDTGVTTNEKAYVLAQQFMRQATGQD